MSRLSSSSEGVETLDTEVTVMGVADEGDERAVLFDSVSETCADGVASPGKSLGVLSAVLIWAGRDDDGAALLAGVRVSCKNGKGKRGLVALGSEGDCKSCKAVEYIVFRLFIEPRS